MSQFQDKIIIITAPSGAGKTSITHFLLKNYPELAFSISAATRQPRAHEKDGVDYYFLSIEDFRQKIREGAFVEWEMVYEGKYYGTLDQDIALRHGCQANKGSHFNHIGQHTVFGAMQFFYAFNC